MRRLTHDEHLSLEFATTWSQYDLDPKTRALLGYAQQLTETPSLIDDADDDRRENAFGLLMSLNMLIETSGGSNATGADCCAWMREAGFRETRLEHLVGPVSMVVGIK